MESDHPMPSLLLGGTTIVSFRMGQSSGILGDDDYLELDLARDGEIIATVRCEHPTITAHGYGPETPWTDEPL